VVSGAVGPECRLPYGGAMVVPAYAESRLELAKKIGLGGNSGKRQ
jgi:predicted transcriptional regulator